jgi:hypothetical protein
MLHEMGHGCGVSTHRDWKTVAERVEHEGISFLTISLPAFSKDFDRSLADGQVGSNHFPGFARSGGLPRFLGGFLRQVFDARTGRLLDDPSIMAIRAVRQFTLLHGKVLIDCSQERVDAAMVKYVECDADVRRCLEDWRPLRATFQKTAAVIFRDLFSAVDLSVSRGEILPKHGPGATADRLVGNDKYTIKEWTTRLDRYFPVVDFALPSPRYWQSLDEVHIREPRDEVPVRVTPVPKTLKTPRIIAIEPSYVQYAQQSLMEAIVDGIEGDDLLSSMIGFSDQLPNQELAREGSLTGELATLDVSDASDRVANLHVKLLTARWPHLGGALQACRSLKADVPGQGVITLAKFASMGSAVCFPVEAMVFLTIVVYSIARQQGVSVSPSLLRELKGKVRVYGDDIIVPTDFAPGVASDLEVFGLRVNRHKSFWSGNFRESCGGDFFRGHRVTPVRVRRTLPEQRRHVEQIVSAVSLRNQLHSRGFLTTVLALDSKIDRLLPVYPEVPANSSALGRHTFGPIQAQRFDERLHQPLVKACVVDQPLPASVLEGRGALMKFFLKRGDLPLSEDAFRRAGRPVSARIKTRWVPTS